jgi:hypothetical protein
VWDATLRPHDTRQVDVQDFIFVALSIVFFVVSIGYVAVCDRLMK